MKRYSRRYAVLRSAVGMAVATQSHRVANRRVCYDRRSCQGLGGDCLFMTLRQCFPTAGNRRGDLRGDSMQNRVSWLARGGLGVFVLLAAGASHAQESTLPLNERSDA
jgi:hypothetical protein